MAIKEVDETILSLNLNNPKNSDGANTVEPPLVEISLKNVSVNDIILTLDENQQMLQNIFDASRTQCDRFIRSSLDYLTILYQTVTEEQKKAMYKCIIDSFVKEKNEYIHHLSVSVTIHIFI